MPKVNGVFGKAVKSVGKGLADSWRWPNVPGRDYTEEDHDKLNRLNTYFTTMAAGVTGSYTVMNNFPVSITIAASAVAIMGGHYLAGVVSEVRRSQDGQGPRP